MKTTAEEKTITKFRGDSRRWCPQNDSSGIPSLDS